MDVSRDTSQGRFLTPRCDNCSAFDHDYTGEWVESGLNGKSQYLCAPCIRVLNANVCRINRES